jgi:CubicO group peptidase (beta-lactamase class C family)/tetratricopeptide (TPR) repeat protein
MMVPHHQRFVAGLIATLAAGAAPAAAQTVQYRSPAGAEYRSQRDTGAIARAQVELAADPRNVERIIQLGVAQSGVRQFREAIQTFTRGLAIAPNDPMLYRWRGHRYLSVRELDSAMADLTRGFRLDSTNYGVLYHLGIVRFARADFAGATDAFARAQRRAPEAGELAGSTDWLWMSLMRAGRAAEAQAMLARHPDSLPATNAYARRLKLYRGEIGPDSVFTPSDTADIQVATLSYGLGNWYLVHGDSTRARAWFERSVRSGGWPAFGFIVSEAELRRMREGARAALIARAKKFELKTRYVPPPGDPLAHHASGFAKIMCSAVFITGLNPDSAAANVGGFTAPFDQRAKMGKPVIDDANRSVHVTLPNGVTRTAKYYGDQGCVTLPIGADSVSYKPRRVQSVLTDENPWPMGDRGLRDPLPPGIDTVKVRQALNAAFAWPEERTAAFVVTWRGRLVGERYGEGITPVTPLESWSMGKSLTATLMGILIKRGVYTLNQPAPIPEWKRAGDPRAKIRIADIMHMSSGLRIRAPQDPDFDPTLGYPDHLYLYTGSVNSFHYAATRPQQWPPNTVGRYRNTDPVLINYLVRLGVEKVGEDYLSFPRRALLDKIGIRTMVMETDPFGNFLTQGYEFASGRDWARLGNLYLQEGVWNGERILPEGWAKFVSTLAPAWKADKRPVYGAFFWINGDSTLPVPKEAYYMSGAGGQTTLIIPSHDLVVVRLGHYRGANAGEAGLEKALELLMQAVPRRK